MTACESVCVRVKCSLTLSTCLPNELALQQNVRQDRKFQAQRDMQCLCKMHRCVELWSIECVRDKVRDTDSDYCKSRIFRMHFIFVYFVRSGFRTKIKCILKIQSKSANPQRSAAVRKFHAYERRGSQGYENLVRTKYSGFTVCTLHCN